MKKIINSIIIIGISVFMMSLTAAAKEYEHTLNAGDMQFSWRLDSENIYIQLTAKTDSWVGIGFDPEEAMQGANIIIGYVKKGKVTIEDHYGNRKTGHKSDESLGGTSDVKDPAGTEKGGMTTISFTLPLTFDDEYDKNIDPGKSTKIMLAHGKGRDSLKTAHPFRALYEVNLSNGQNSKIK